MTRWTFALDGFKIVGSQSIDCARSTPNPIGMATASLYPESIRSHGSDFFLYLPLSSLSQADHGNNSGHPDDDSQHGEKGANLVSTERCQGNP